MNESDREAITRNIARLVEQTDLDKLIPKLLEKGVFSTIMIEKYLGNGILSLQQRKTELYLDIQRRGPEAFAKLLEALNETGHLNLVLLLRPNYVQNNVTNGSTAVPLYISNRSQNHGCSTVPTHLPSYYPEGVQNHLRELASLHPNAVFNMRTEPLKVSVKQATSRLDGVHPKGHFLRIYPMGSRPKGYFLMINNIKFINDIYEERRGAEVDEQNLTLLFEGLGYEVFKHRDLNRADMMSTIYDFSQLPAHKNVHSCVLAILSHGDDGEEPGSTDISAADGGKVSTRWILDRFNNYYCPNLIERPKIFIFQVCRGGLEDFGVNMARPHKRISTDGRPTIKVRSYSDMLMAYSTIPGYVSRRDFYTGTWYIEKICKVFMEHACDTDIKDLLTMVDNELKPLLADNDSMQTSSFESWGFQKFYFNPGLYDDDSSTNELVSAVAQL